MTYIPVFIKTGSGIQQFIREDTHRQQSDPIIQRLFFLKKGNYAKKMDRTVP
jgi:hypothetical protein